MAVDDGIWAAEAMEGEVRGGEAVWCGVVWCGRVRGDANIPWPDTLQTRPAHATDPKYNYFEV